MWLKDSVISDVERVALIRYVGVDECRRWNEHRREGELRLLTGWMWAAKRGRSYQHGFKTRTIALIDAWYHLVAETEAPAVDRPRLRVVSRRAA